MSWVDPFHVRSTVSMDELSMSDGEEVDKFVRDALVAQMVAYAEDKGFANFSSTAIRIEVHEENTTDRMVYKASWYPRPEWPVEFERGILDGAKRKIQPLKLVTVPVDPEPETPIFSAMSAQVTRYKRAGINPVTNRWVYIPEN